VKVRGRCSPAGPKSPFQKFSHHRPETTIRIGEIRWNKLCTRGLEENVSRSLACVCFPLPSIPSIAISNPRVVMSSRGLVGAGPPVPHSVSQNPAACKCSLVAGWRDPRPRGKKPVPIVRIFISSALTPLSTIPRKSAAASPQTRRGRPGGASRKAGKRLALIGVSKNASGRRLRFREAYDAGLREFGENRVSGMGRQTRAQVADLQATWHLIGHLQSNKSGLARAKAFHSIDFSGRLVALPSVSIRATSREGKN